MSSFGIPYESIPSHFDEGSIRDEDLSVRAEKLARAKGEEIASRENGIIVSADTFSKCEGRVFEKPKDIDEAYEMLMFLSGKEAMNYTGFCYIDRQNNIDFSTCVVTKYKFRTLYEDEIRKFVKENPVTNWAAGFALVTPYINSFVSNVEGSLTALSYGLPTELLIEYLKKSGIEPRSA